MEDRFSFTCKSGGKNYLENCILKGNHPHVGTDRIGGGDPHWYLHGSMIRFIKTDIFWADLYRLLTAPEKFTLDEIKEVFNAYQYDPTGPSVIFEGETPSKIDYDVKPYPLLILHDRTGALGTCGWYTERVTRLPCRSMKFMPSL